MDVWSTKFPRLSLFLKATKCTQNLVCAEVKHCFQGVSISFLLGAATCDFDKRFCMAVEVQSSSLIRGWIVPPVISSPAEGLKHVESCIC